MSCYYSRAAASVGAGTNPCPAGFNDSSIFLDETQEN